MRLSVIQRSMALRRPGSVQVHGESTSERLQRAKGYPYPRPQCSYVFVTSRNGTAWHEVVAPWPSAAWNGAHVDAEALLSLPLGPPRPVHDTSPSPSDGSEADEAAAGRPAPLRDVLRAAYGLDAAALLLNDSNSGSGGGSSASASAWSLAPILAIGSNAAPEQLARKFPPSLFPDGAVVPVVQCAVEGLDVVFAPLVASYGSCAATLEPSAGTVAEVFATLLTPPLQRRMHETEGAYDLLALRGVRLAVGASVRGVSSGAEGGGGEAEGGSGAPATVPATVYSYNCSSGTLHLPLCEGGNSDGSGSGSGSDAGQGMTGASPVALAEIPALRRSFPALAQLEMQAALYHAFSGGSSGSSGSASDAEQAVEGVAAALQPVSLKAAVATAAAAAAASAASASAGSLSSLGASSSYDDGDGGERRGDGSGSEDGGSGGGDTTSASSSSSSSIDEFILSNLNRPSLRAARVQALAACARPFDHPCAEKLLTLGAMMDHV